MKLDFSARETPTGIHYRNDGYGIFRESHSQRQNGFGFFASQNTDLLFLFLSSSRNFGKEERKSRNEKGHFLHVRFTKGIRKGKQNGLRFQDSFRHNRCHMLSPV
jgi:hypothetical protein